MKRRRPLSHYLVRTCQTMHECDGCDEPIVLGQHYYDGGYARRAHINCGNADETDVDAAAPERRGERE